MRNKAQQERIDFIWKIANLLRGPYRPPQYRKVMLPLTVLWRLDSVLLPTKEDVIKKHQELEPQDLPDKAVERILKKEAGLNFYNTSPLTLGKMVDAHENLDQDLKTYIKSFSKNARKIIQRFQFEEEIDKLEESNRLYKVMKEFKDVDLSPATVSNLDMGYIFEELIRRFNEQANEEAGDHFTPREVIELMANVLYTYDDDLFNKEGLLVKIYDPTCGTGGMLSESERYIEQHSEGLNIELFGQEFNDESWAICASDMLIKGESPENIVFGDTLGDGKTEDGYKNETFHYMLANPPYGVEWYPEEDVVKKEHEDLGFNGRFGAGYPRIDDGSFLFLQHMISKMVAPPEDGGRGSRIGIVFNASPLYSGNAGSGTSNIRRWIIENDWLETIIALPDQLFYNTGINTYIWIVTNRKRPDRRGSVQLIDGTEHYQDMDKSLGSKRHEITSNQIDELTNIYGAFEECKYSKICDIREFGFIKLTVERPLRLNFQATDRRIKRLWDERAFNNLAKSRKRKDKKAQKEEIKKGEKKQEAIIEALKTLDSSIIYKNREKFMNDVEGVLDAADISVKKTVRDNIWKAIAEQDETANICRDSKGNPEPDSDLRDYENVPFPNDIKLPLPLGYHKDSDLSELLEQVKDYCDQYFENEVKPHFPDAWVDYEKIKIGYEIPLYRKFYDFDQTRDLEEIEADIKNIEQDIVDMLGDITGSNKMQ
ncbi:HsdM family class I SAM-dependent methyltransferase [Fodinibius roseus]|uniref:type I restriction-modification system subunit M n=1 Tax=Fodinibius roseus TaxID=1194090 RepID=UPI000932D3C2